MALITYYLNETIHHPQVALSFYLNQVAIGFPFPKFDPLNITVCVCLQLDSY